jgi:FkbM family methyltransferase
LYKRLAGLKQAKCRPNAGASFQLAFALNLLIRSNHMPVLQRVFQLLPDHLRGKQRLARWVLKLLGKLSCSHRVQGSYGCIFRVPNLVENVSFELFINGAYERETLDYMVAQIGRNARVLDIGANIGALAIPLAVRRPDLTVHCVEASPHVAKYLRENIALNQLTERVFVHEIALSDRAEATIDFFSPEDLFGKGSMISAFSKKALTVKNTSLDRFLDALPDRVHFIKVDVEGFEENVFQSGKTHLSAMAAPDIVFEVCGWAEDLAGHRVGAAQATLRTFGYQLAALSKPERPVTRFAGEELVMAVAKKEHSQPLPTHATTPQGLIS